MSENLEAVILGIIQGLTEFLPVSSSGHLEIAKYIFGENTIAEESMLLTVVLHFATALSTILVFRKDIVDIIKGVFTKEDDTSRKFVFWIVLSMIPAGLIGVFADDLITSMFSDNLLIVSCMLIITGGLLYFADIPKNNHGDITYKNALVIGVSQAIAIIPGISRSGATISTALLLGVDRNKAARFSFLMVVPLIFGKIILDLLKGDFSSINYNPTELTLGFIAAFISGIFACKWMIRLVQKASLKYFSYYCFIIAFIGIIYVFST